MPLFSVIIPLYNKSKHIEATLKSVTIQTFTDFEVIVVNDVSTDDSLMIAQTVKDDRIRIINHSVNKGLSASRNTGIQNAKSDFIAFLDADDLWKPDFLRTIHQLLIQYPDTGIFATKYEEVHPKNIVLPIGVTGTQLKENQSYLLDFFSTNMGKLAVSFSSLAMRKDILNDVGTFDEEISYAEDIDFYIRAFYEHKLAYLNTSLACYMIYDNHQMSLAGLKNKTIPNFDKYEYMADNRPEIKRFLDFYRYIMAKQYKLDTNRLGYIKMLNGIDLSSLNYKQITLLYAPAFALKLIKKIKALLLRKGINPTTY